MITVNLGQIGVFKTDVSNAADAGALAAASILSAYLLGIGLLSDQMFGYMLMELVVIVAAIVEVIKIPVAIAVAIIVYVKMLTQYFKALKDSKIAWANAKKTALQYAFSNAGIDEPRPTFKEFVKKVYGEENVENLSVSYIKKYNDIYILGDNPEDAKECPQETSSNKACIARRKLIKETTQSGFSSFMDKSLYWDESILGKIGPGYFSPQTVTSGYGWTVDDQGEITNIITNPDKKYIDFDNYVEVKVSASSIYPLKLYNPLSKLFDSISSSMKQDIKDEDVPWFVKWVILEPITWILDILSAILRTFLPAGLMMEPIDTYTNRNPIFVTVRRYKRNKNLGMWNFRYGTVESRAVSHVYDEDPNDFIPRDIKPTIGVAFEGMVNGTAFYSILRSLLAGKKIDDSLLGFDTTQHLFESEIITTR
jgi:hypothetical protein